LGFSLIVKPPALRIGGLSAANRKRFFDDTDEIVRKIMSGYKDEKVNFTAIFVRKFCNVYNRFREFRVTKSKR
jgi:hypothetical protein